MKSSMRKQRHPGDALHFAVRRAVRSACLAGGAAAVMMASHTTLAATATASDTDNETQLQEVVVTGSHLMRTDTETSSPVQVITAEEIHESGYTSTQQVLNQLTANGQGTLSQSFSGAFASGAAGVALRGLNVGATLVLIDGHRTAPYPIGDDGQRSFVDVANLPFDAIERVEVLKDGASAIYGSDAIAGVVNIILKKTFQGAQFTAEDGISSHGDGNQIHLSGIFGMGDMDTDGHNFYISAEYRKQDTITFADRGGEFTKNDYTNVGGIDFDYGATGPLTGNTPSRSVTGYLTNPTTGAIVGFFPGCNATLLAANKCTHEDTWDQIQPPTENINATLRFTQAIATDWTADFEGGYFESKSEQVNSPDRSSTITAQGVILGPGLFTTLAPPLNPITMPNTNPSYPAGTGLAAANLRYSFLNSLGPTVTDTDAKSYRAVIDLNGKAAGFDIDASLGFTEVTLNEQGFGIVNPTNLQTALNSTTAPFLLGQPNSGSVLGFISPTLVTNDTSKLGFGHLGASRDLFTLPGGPFGIAVGGDWFVRDQYAVAPLGIQNGEYQIGEFSNNFTIGTQQVESGYAEFNAPVVKMLDLDGAVRYDHYNISGGRASPKLGFKFTPIPQVAFRGTWSLGFRAPGPAENGTAGQSFFAATEADPVLCPHPTNVTAPGNFVGECVVTPAGLQTTNKTLKPETSKSYTLGLVLQPFQDLSATIDWYSIEIDHQIVGGGPSTTVRSTNLSPLQEYCTAGAGGCPAGGIETVVPPVGPIAYTTLSYVNANTTKTEGFDLGLQYQHRFGSFNYQSKATWSYTSEYNLTIDGTTYHLAGTHGPFFFTGDTGNPRSRIQWSNSIGQDNWEVTGTMNYIDSFNVTDPSSIAFVGAPQDTCLESLQVSGAASIYYANQLANGVIPKGVSCSVAHYIEFDLYGRYAITKHLDVHGSVLNLFNEKAPADWETYGGALGLVPWNPSMHLQGAIGPFFTLGATYKF
jgi:iron complex outermembrane receptor protein